VSAPESSPHILVVDDDRDIRELLSRYLVRNGLRVSVARDAREMEQVMHDSRIDLVVLDLMLPGKDGLTICRELQGKSAPPMIMLTAMGEATDRIVGLELGADDYLAKPFEPRELLARVRAVLRRRQAAGPIRHPTDRSLHFAGWMLELSQRRLTSQDGTLVSLSPGEYDLLLAFAERPQRTLSRDQLLDLTRGRSAAPFDRSIDVLVSRLRHKVEANPQDPALILTVRGGGYMLSAEVARQ
jgi:two-component system, OmpR family, response regulator